MASVSTVFAARAGEALQLADDSSLDAADWIVFGSVVGASLVIGIALARVVRRALARLAIDETIAVLLSRLTAALVVVIGLVYGLTQLGVRVGPLLGAVGLGGLALALAVQGMLADLLAGIVLHGRRPFRIGDEISTADHQGTVVDIGTRAVEIRLYDGEHTFVPNSMVLGNPFTTITAEPLRRFTLEVGVAYGTPLRTALDVVTAAARSVPDVVDEPQPVAHVTEFGDSGIHLALWYWHLPQEDVRWRVRTAVSLAVEAGFAETGITIPFPQRVLWSGERNT